MPSSLPSSMLTGTACAEQVSLAAYVAAMVRFEVALARAQASLGLMPPDAAAAIAAAAQDVAADLERIATEGHAAGTPVVELLNQLRAHLERQSPGARAFLHAGAASQDVLDTAMVVCVKPCVMRGAAALEHARLAAFRLAAAHASSPMLARTLMQAGGVTTFGLKAAQWGAAAARCERRLRDAATEGLAVQLGGPVGSGLGFGDRWFELQSAVARALDLEVPPGPWQATRDAWVNVLMQLGLATAVAVKIAGDVALMCQSELGEAREPSAGAGVSSSMPHKRNPVLCMRIRGCGHVVQGLTASLLSTTAIEHERGLGSWQAELAVAPSLVTYAVSALGSLAILLQGIEFDEARARHNIDEVRARIGGAAFDQPRGIEAAARTTHHILSEYRS